MKCMKNKTLRKFGYASFTTTFDRPEDYKILSKYSVYVNRSKENEVDNMFDDCRHSMPGKPCWKVLYMPALVSIRDSESVTFLLYDMSGPEYTLIFHPATFHMDLYVQVSNATPTFKTANLSLTFAPFLSLSFLVSDHECLRCLAWSILCRHPLEFNQDHHAKEDSHLNYVSYAFIHGTQLVSFSSTVGASTATKDKVGRLTRVWTNMSE